MIGESLDGLLIPEHHRTGHNAGLRHYLNTGEGPYIGRRIEVEAVRKDGGVLQAELSISVARGERGDIFIGYMRDINRAETSRGAEFPYSRRSFGRHRRWRPSVT